MKIDYQNNGEDFLLHFWGQKEAFPLLQKAIALDLFTAVGEGKGNEEIEKMISSNSEQARLFLDVLVNAGLLIREGGYLNNAPVAQKVLVSSSPHYCGDEMQNGKESGVFVAERLFPMLGEANGHCVLIGNLPFIEQELAEKCPALDFSAATTYDWIITDQLNENVLKKSTADGMIAVIGRFQGDYGLAGAVSLYNAYLQGKYTSAIDEKALSAFNKEHALYGTNALTLTDSFSVAFIAKQECSFERLTLTTEAQLVAALKKLPIHSVKEIDPADIVTAPWAKDHCRFGCSTYGEKCCPPLSPNYDATQTKIDEYKKALLIEGQPPTRDFQRMMLKVEKAAFQTGYYKAFIYWSGPCSLCTTCNPPAPPKKCTATRPSMESAGIDVFATVRRQGYEMKTLKDKTEYAKYFGLLLLE